MRELPPILRGDEKQQLIDNRNYLVRLCNELDAQFAELAEKLEEYAAATGASTETVTMRFFQEQLSKLRLSFIPVNGLSSHYSEIERQVEETCRRIIGGN